MIRPRRPKETFFGESIVLSVVRRLEVHSVHPNSYEVRCSECGWFYLIEHRGPVINELEETLAASEFTNHVCANFPRARGQTS